MPEGVSDKVDKFFSAYPIKHYPKDTLIILADEDPKHIIHLVKGQVREYDISKRGDEIVVNVFKPPAFFPMSWAINRSPNQYFFQAATDIAAHIAPPDEVVGFLKANPDVMYDLLSRLYHGVDGLLRRMAHLMGGSAKSRLIFELLIESRRFGEAQPNASHAVVISEGELGARAGLSRETISREIASLKNIGLISIERQKIFIQDLDKLELELGSEL